MQTLVHTPETLTSILKQHKPDCAPEFTGIINAILRNPGSLSKHAPALSGMFGQPVTPARDGASAYHWTNAAGRRIVLEIYPHGDLGNSSNPDPPGKTAPQNKLAAPAPEGPPKTPPQAARIPTKPASAHDAQFFELLAQLTANNTTVVTGSQTLHITFVPHEPDQNKYPAPTTLSGTPQQLAEQYVKLTQRSPTSTETETQC